VRRFRAAREAYDAAAVQGGLPAVFNATLASNSPRLRGRDVSKIISTDVGATYCLTTRLLGLDDRGAAPAAGAGVEGAGVRLAPASILDLRKAQANLEKVRFLWGLVSFYLFGYHS
jgi:hypothetical protein